MLRSLLACAVAALTAAAPAWADPVPLSVAPVTVALDLRQDFGHVEVGNRGDQSTGVEVRVVRLTWQDGTERHAPTEDFIVTPPSFQLPASSQRVVRFKFVGGRSDAEHTYRLLIRQLPTADPTPGAVQMSITQGIPIFVAPSAAHPALALAQAGERTRLVNAGNVTLHVDALGGPGCTLPPLRLGDRLFPGQWVELRTPPPPCASVASTRTGDVPLARPR